MYPRISKVKAGDTVHHYLRIVRSVRDGSKVRQQVVANLGSLDKFTEADVDSIINGLCRIFDRPVPDAQPEFETAVEYGDIHALLHLWKELKLTQILARRAERSRTKFDLVGHVKAMVVNRLCDPKSKLALLSWLEGIYLPGVDRSEMKYENLLRAMDWLIEEKEEVEKELCNSVLTLFDQELDLVFYDITSSYFETELTDELRRYGYSRDHRSDCPQVVIGMVTTREGIPVCHHVFPGNTLDKTTVQEVIRDLKKRFPISRAVFVGDRGMLSRENIEVIEEEGLRYIVAVNVRQDKDTQALLLGFQDEIEAAQSKWRDEQKRYQATGELPEGCASEDEMLSRQRLFGEDEVNGRRLVVEHGEEVRRVSRQQRLKRLKRTEEGMSLVLGKLEEQDQGKKSRGRDLSEGGALVKLHELTKKNRLTGPYKLEMKDGYLHVLFDEMALEWESVLDGKLVVETNLTDLSAEEVIRQYRDLREIEASFRVLKSAIEIRPMNHWKPHRIKAHVFICVLALVIERAMRCRLKKSGQTTEPHRVLEQLRAIRVITAKTAHGKAKGLTRATDKQLELYQALGVPAPALSDIQ